MNATHRVRPLLEFGAWADNDPFLGLMEDWFPRGVFDRHPHRGIETVTYVLEGELEHYDNHGNAGIIRPGDAQWVTAGRGVIHNEIPAEGVTVHSLQLWVNLPAVRLRSAAPAGQLGLSGRLGLTLRLDHQVQAVHCGPPRHRLGSVTGAWTQARRGPRRRKHRGWVIPDEHEPRP
ncbi:MAG: pirin family protein [Alphaproteobacteria bacterium]|nr:pirin family protein [Alphaproteobacteria bacterium]